MTDPDKLLLAINKLERRFIADLRNAGVSLAPNAVCSIGSSFTRDDLPSYWRAIHAREVLIHWDYVFSLAKQFCKKYQKLID